MQLDMLDIVVPTLAFRQNNGLMGTNGFTWTYLSNPDANGLQTLVYMKGQNVSSSMPGYIANSPTTKAGGFPWDWLVVAEDFIYQRLTEYIWNDPSTGKLMFGLGSPRIPRFIDYSVNQPPGMWIFSVSQPQTDYIIYGSGGIPIPNSRFSDAMVTNVVRGPFPGAATGDLPSGEDWCLDYIRNNGKYKETITCRRNYGRYQWQQFVFTGGQWIQDVDANNKPLLSIVNKVIQGPCPNPLQLIF